MQRHRTGMHRFAEELCLRLGVLARWALVGAFFTAENARAPSPGPFCPWRRSFAKSFIRLADESPFKPLGSLSMRLGIFGVEDNARHFFVESVNGPESDSQLRFELSPKTGSGILGAASTWHAEPTAKLVGRDEI